MVEPSGGLFSTAPDLARFYGMIAGGGVLDGVRILSEAAVRDMTRPVDAGGKPQPYAAGWQYALENQRGSGPLPAGSFGHGGAFATHGWVFPKQGLVTVFLVQNVLVPDSGKAKDVFQKLALEASGMPVPPPVPAKK
jgi:CubicO group peptidase (beta-lactamase class C family)